MFESSKGSVQKFFKVRCSFHLMPKTYKFNNYLTQYYKLNHFKTAILYRFDIGPEIALSNGSLIATIDLRLDVNLSLAFAFFFGT